MNLKSEIKSQVINHLNRFDIFSSRVVDDIVNSVIDGNFAFQLIYDDTSTLIEWRVLDWNLVKQRPDTNGGLIFSHDGGKRYQWFESETLLIDMRIIRELKLNNILQ